jgi:hypothetical protein
MEYQMTKLPFIAAALVVAGGLAAPALAATATSATNVPYCATGEGTDYDSRADSLATQLHLLADNSATVTEWNGCLKVTTIADGKSVMKFYDPDSFKLVAEIG